MTKVPLWGLVVILDKTSFFSARSSIFTTYLVLYIHIYFIYVTYKYGKAYCGLGKRHPFIHFKNKMFGREGGDIGL